MNTCGECLYSCDKRALIGCVLTVEPNWIQTLLLCHQFKMHFILNYFLLICQKIWLFFHARNNLDEKINNSVALYQLTVDTASEFLKNEEYHDSIHGIQHNILICQSELKSLQNERDRGFYGDRGNDEKLIKVKENLEFLLLQLRIVEAEFEVFNLYKNEDNDEKSTNLTKNLESIVLQSQKLKAETKDQDFEIFNPDEEFYKQYELNCKCS